MQEEGFDAILAYGSSWRRDYVRSIVNYPVSGAFAWAALNADGRDLLFADPLEIESAQLESNVAVVEPLDIGWPEKLAALLRGWGVHKVGLAGSQFLPSAIYQRISKLGFSIESANALVDAVRLKKDAWELNNIRQASAIADRGWVAFREAASEGLKEFELLAVVEAAVKQAGAEDNFMIMASGGKDVRSMRPAGSRPFRRGDLLRTEITPQINGYWSQICRCLYLGDPPAEVTRAYDIFLEAEEAGMKKLKPGATAGEIAQAQNEVFAKHGYGKYATAEYTRTRGHGLGLHLDETPALMEDDSTVLLPGMTMIVHPNTFLPLAGYMVLGDPIVITETGYEQLTSTERKLFIK